jgi:hypothetical protein
MRSWVSRIRLGSGRSASASYALRQWIAVMQTLPVQLRPEPFHFGQHLFSPLSIWIHTPSGSSWVRQSSVDGPYLLSVSSSYLTMHHADIACLIQARAVIFFAPVFHRSIPHKFKFHTHLGFFEFVGTRLSSGGPASASHACSNSSCNYADIACSTQAQAILNLHPFLFIYYPQRTTLQLGIRLVCTCCLFINANDIHYADTACSTQACAIQFWFFFCLTVSLNKFTLN